MEAEHFSRCYEKISQKETKGTKNSGRGAGLMQNGGLTSNEPDDYLMTCQTNLLFRCSLADDSASFTSRHRATPSPCAIESATLILGIRSPRSISEIIFDDKSAFSANFSCVSFASLRRRCTVSAKDLAKFLETTLRFCQP